MAPEREIEIVLREEMARRGIETANLPSGAISVRKAGSLTYEVIADYGPDVRGVGSK